MAHLLKRFFLLAALLAGAWLVVNGIFSFASFSTKTQFVIQECAFGAALVVYIKIIVFEKIKLRRRQHS